MITVERLSEMSEKYKSAGVDIHAGYESVKRIQKHIKRTNTPGVIGGLGGFGGLFSLVNHKMEEPVLVSGTDGVGTKLLISQEMGKYNTVGIDLVAMCANDIITMGATPLFFLDYISIGKQNPDKIEQIVEGVAEGCVRAGCALVGGEMAEHPDMMGEDEFDLAGFCVGIVDKKSLVTGASISEGDVIIGVESSGVHSNGFSLIRKLIKDNNLVINKFYPKIGGVLGELLLTPTRLYCREIASLCSQLSPKGMAHITGGGFIENIPRILPSGLAAEINTSAWDIPPIFSFISEEGNISAAEMFNLFNMGFGFIIVTSRENADKSINIIGEGCVIGNIVRGEDVILKGI